MMFKTRKLTSALVAAGLLSASVLPGTLSAQTLSNNGGGSAVVVPYYNANEGWQTLLNVTNTSDNSIVVKVRLHEARNSRDVLDFNIALSPRDVWTGWIRNGGAGRPFIETTDRSCTIPLLVRDNGVAAREVAYSDEFVDHAGTDGDLTRMSEGYVTFLVMGETEGNGSGPSGDGTSVTDLPGEGDFRGSTAYFAEHVNGEPRNCETVESDFVNRSGNWDPGTDEDPGTIPGQDDGDAQTGSGSPLARIGSIDSDGGNASTVGYGEIDSGTPLKVNASVVNPARGLAAGVESLHIAGWGNGDNLVTAQQFPWFLEPSLASGESGALWDMSDLNDLEAEFSANSIGNEWASNPVTGASTDWVATMPSKRFHADNDAYNVQAACNLWRNTLTSAGVPADPAADLGTPIANFPEEDESLAIMSDAACPLAPFENLFQAGNDGVSEITITYEFWDREEQSAMVETDGVTVSPAPPPEITIDSLRYETNVLSVGVGASGPATSALGSLIAGAVDTSEIPSEANTGWMEASFDNPLPVTGFLFKLRDLGIANRNFGQATEHFYDRAD